MKHIQIRNSVFETNSSSTHSLTLVTKEQFKALKNGDLFLDPFKENGDIMTFEELKNYYKGKDEENLRYDYSYKAYLNAAEDNDYETFEVSKVVGGVEVVAFGYHGYDG